MRMLIVVFATIGVLALAAPLAGAQAHGRHAGHPRVIQLQAIHIEGRVQKPNAFYILNRSNLGYQVMELRTSFVRNIIRSVQGRPF